MSRKAMLAEHDGKFYVKLKYSGVPWLCALIDSLPLIRFKGEKTIYISLEDWENWHRTEAAAGVKESEKWLVAAEKTRENIAAGKVVWGNR